MKKMYGLLTIGIAIMITSFFFVPMTTQLDNICIASSSSLEDADEDGLTDGEEMFYGTNSLNWDTDSDGFGDACEVWEGTNPLDQNSCPE